MTTLENSQTSAHRLLSHSPTYTSKKNVYRNWWWIE